jgi:hypothetical protein
MKMHSYQDMLNEYGSTDIDSYDLDDRQEKLSRLKYSLIIEGDFLEYENAEKWIRDNLNIAAIEFVFYGKTGYNYGFMEYFFSNESDFERFKNTIPNIYTEYPNGTCSKSDGYDKHVSKV